MIINVKRNGECKKLFLLLKIKLPKNLVLKILQIITKLGYEFGIWIRRRRNHNGNDQLPVPGGIFMRDTGSVYGSRGG